VLAQIEEICGKYKCEGIFFDMTFWPYVCYCQHCSERYKKETGMEPPRVVDWQNPEWVNFQRSRERWIEEFASVTTKKVHLLRPAMTVTHQFSTVIANWRQAVPFSLVEASDYLSGDFYGENIQQSIICKIFHSLSRKKPFEFHTSKCLDLRDHVTIKTSQRLQTQTSLAPAHGSAFMFIDPIDPDGSLNPGVYQKIRSVFDKVITPYEPYLGGELCADVAVYFSEESRFDPSENGINVAEAKSGRMPHLEALTGACRALKEHHIPFTVIARRNLSQLSKFKVLVLSDVLSMDSEEVGAFRAFVLDGGSLYASYRTATRDRDGNLTEDFLLADILGVSTRNEQTPDLTFFTPMSREMKEFFYPQDHLIHPQRQLVIENRSGQIIATQTLPYTDPERGEIFGKTFSSIHSNPPGKLSKDPAIVLHRAGKGRTCYVAGALEAVNQEINKRVFANLVRMLMNRPAWFEVKTHPAVEVVLLHQPEEKRFLISLVKTAPLLVDAKVDATVRLRLEEGAGRVKLIELPEKKEILFRRKEWFVEFDLKDFSGPLYMAMLDYA